MNTKRRYTYIKICALVLLVWLTACRKDDPHEGEGGLTVALDNSRCPDVPIGPVTLCIYGTDGNLAATYNYADARGIAAALILLPAGHYTLGVVINAAPETDAMQTLTALHEWVETEADANRQLLSGMAEVDVAAEGISRAYVPLYQRAFPLPVLRLLLALPTQHLPDYTPTKKTRAANDGYIIRCVAELVKLGTDKVVLHKPVTPEPQADGTYLVELAVPEGNYDLRLWTDYARTDTPLADTYYQTESLKAVSIVTEPYVANTDTKDAAYHNESNLTLPEESTTINVQLLRPLAKYRILADDVEAYRKLTEADPQKYPPLEELTVTVQYEGYFPSEFNVISGKPVNSITGGLFAAHISSTMGRMEEVLLASDWVFADEEGSFVKLTLIATDNKGNEVTRVSGIRVDYRQGYLTTLRGNFLTESQGGGGITIDTDWKDIVIEF